MEFCIGSKVFVDWNKSNNYLKDKYPEFVEITDKVVGDKIYYYCKVNDNTYAWFKEDWIIIEKGFMIPFGEAEPKFKVGDRVKIDWDEIDHIVKQNIFNSLCALPDEVVIKLESEKSSLGRYAYLVYSEHYPQQTFCMFEEHLTLAESNPKFKVGDVVIADLVRIGWKLLGCDEEAEAKIIEIDDEFIYIKLLRDRDCSAHFTFKDNEEFKYIKYPSKPKWSVDTYVEFLEDYQLSSGNYVPKGIYEILEYLKDWDRIIIDINGFEKWTFDVTKLRIGKVKWHENKPEKKEAGFNKNSIKADMCGDWLAWTDGVNSPKMLNIQDLYNIKGVDIIELNSGKRMITQEKEDSIKSCVYYNGGDIFICDENGNKLTVDDSSINWKSPQHGLFVKHKDWYFEADGKTNTLHIIHKYLYKPNIHISKQKQTKININKPII